MIEPQKRIGSAERFALLTNTTWVLLFSASRVQDILRTSFSNAGPLWSGLVPREFMRSVSCQNSFQGFRLKFKLKVVGIFARLHSPIPVFIARFVNSRTVVPTVCSNPVASVCNHQYTINQSQLADSTPHADANEFGALNPNAISQTHIIPNSMQRGRTDSFPQQPCIMLSRLESCSAIAV